MLVLAANYWWAITDTSKFIQSVATNNGIYTDGDYEYMSHPTLSKGDVIRIQVYESFTASIYDAMSPPGVKVATGDKVTIRLRTSA